METVVTKDGKTTVYPWKLKQLTKEEEEEEKERTKAFKEEEEKLRAERMIGEPYKWDQPNIAAIIAEQLQNIIPQIVTQVTVNVNNARMPMVEVAGDVRANIGVLISLFSVWTQRVRREGRQMAPVNAVRMSSNQRACYECGSLDHLKPTCPKLNRAPADFSFISTELVSMLNVKPRIVNPGYEIEIADGKRVEVNRVVCDCKLELGNSLFDIELIPIGYGSFDVEFV
ncbi:hypothetical protein Tco_0600204 [Tanacetum coccineum]|uniref:CCHC-type domain-containing protein n=1 Tax=Tanacetum coccineum TaxID=301880 RepID=A0ABQ4WB54_9ASTR